MEHPVVLFDGVCNLCNSSVTFIIRRDPQGKFRFAPLQSAHGEKLLAGFTDRPKGDSVVLILGDRYFVKTSAALRIAIRLNGLWPLMGIFLILPSFLRDPVYDLIARYRYQWFGKRDSCMIPTPELRERFL